MLSIRLNLIPRTLRQLKPKRLSVRPVVTQTRTMAFSPRGFFHPDASFSPLFRLLDDFDNYSRQEGGNWHNQRSGLTPFQPRFDVRETGNGYELHGELPGIRKEDIHLDFTDPQSMLISGKLERTYTVGSPPTGLIESGNPNAAITGVENTQQLSTNTSIKKHEGENAGDDAKYWLTERSVGTFSRTFNFPSPVDQDAVLASLRDGILSIVVPKAKKAVSCRITIN